MPCLNNRDGKFSVGALMKMPYHTCSRYGHRKSAYRTDGSSHHSVKGYKLGVEFTSSLDQYGMNNSANGYKDSSGSRKTIFFKRVCDSGHL